MNVTLILPGTLPYPCVKGGGVETLVDSLVRYNESHGEHRLTVYSIYDPEAEKEARSLRHCTMKFIRIPRGRQTLSRYFCHVMNKLPKVYIGNIFLRKALKMLKRDTDSQLIIVENACQFGLKIKDAVSVPVLLHLHNDYLHRGVHLAEEVLHSYDSILTVSDFLKKQVLSIEAPFPVSTVLNGIDLSLFGKQNLSAESRIAARKKLGILPNECVFVFSGRLSPEKGVAELIEAFLKLSPKYPVKLIIAGSSAFAGSGKTAYVRHLYQMARPAQDRILFLGYVPHAELPAVYSLADAGVVPSTWEEPFGLTVVEQMAVGLPIIVSDSGGIPEIVTNDCALVVPRGEHFANCLSEAMEKFVQNAELRKMMGDEAKLQAQRFSEEVYCERFFGQINSFMQARKYVNE
jgi:spore coat protein SA